MISNDALEWAACSPDGVALIDVHKLGFQDGCSMRG